MKKPKFKIGEEVVVVVEGKKVNSGFIEEYEKAYCMVSRKNTWIGNKLIYESDFEIFKIRGMAQRIDENTWHMDGCTYKHSNYRYYILNDNCRLGTVNNMFIKNKEKFEAKLVAKLVAERLRKQK